MHLAFIPYGIKNIADFVLEDLNHKYLPLKLWREGEKDKFMLLQIQIRVLPFGVYELVFPREYLQEVMSALKVKSEEQQGEYKKRLNKTFMGFKPLDVLRKFLKLKPIPNYKYINHPNFPMPDTAKHISFIPIGIREDRDMTEEKGTYKGWTHEAI